MRRDHMNQLLVSNFILGLCFCSCEDEGKAILAEKCVKNPSQEKLMKQLMMSMKRTMLLLLSARLTVGQTWKLAKQMGNDMLQKRRTHFQDQLATRAVFVGWRNHFSSRENHVYDSNNVIYFTSIGATDSKSTRRWR